MKTLAFICALFSSVLINTVKIEYVVGKMHEECPCVISDDFIVENIDTDWDNNVVLDIIVDDAYLYGVSFADALIDPAFSRSLIKEFLVDNLRRSRDSDFRDFIQLVRKAEYNIILHFGGFESNIVYEIVITYNEL